MSETCPEPVRPWREIAEEVTTEADSDKVLELSQELVAALEKENKPHLQHTPEHGGTGPQEVSVGRQVWSIFDPRPQSGYRCTKWRF